MLGFQINHTSALSNTKQLQNQIRAAILEGRLIAGDRLPSTRTLSKDMLIARNTVIEAYEQLVAEGYLESTLGSGTYVANIGTLPRHKLPPDSSVADLIPPAKAWKAEDIIAFDAGCPDIASFPRTQWAKLLKESCMSADSNSLTYHDDAGNIRLRKAISNYAYRMKGIQCKQEQVVIVPGASGGMEVLAKVFLREKNRIALEDPCIHFVKTIFSDHGYELCPVEVGDQGMSISSLGGYSDIDLIYIVPSHQFPMGEVFPAAQRIALLQYANDQNAYIIEDDYDSEFRYKGEALQAMVNLDQERVIYLGSFSKILAPALRIGYMILPEQLCEKVTYQLQQTNLRVGGIEQLAMAAFLEQRLLDRHIYRMRKLYETKRKHLMKLLHDTFGNQIEITGEYAGMHLLVSFMRELTEMDRIAFDDCGVEIDYVEDYAIVKGKHTNRIVLGYGGLSLTQMEEGVLRIKSAMDGVK